MHKNFLTKIYAYIFLYDLSFAYAVYNLLFADNGLSGAEISILLGWWAFVAVVFEIPSGVLADILNRKWLIFAAPVLKGLAFLLWGAIDGNFFIYAFGFLLWGLGSTLITGTYQAYIYDVLAQKKRQDDYEKVIGKVSFFKKFAISLGLVFGGILASFSINLAMIASTIPLLIGALIALSFAEVRVSIRSEEVKYFDYIRDSLKFIQNSKSMRFLFLSLVVISVFGNLEEYDQLYFKLVDLPIALFGVVAFVSYFGSAVIEGLSYKVKGNQKLFVVLPLISASLLIIVGLFPSIPVLIVLVSAYILISPLNVLVDGRIQHEITGKSRATIISFSNFLKHIVGIGYYVLFALIIQFTSLQGIYFLSAIILIVFSCLALFRTKNL